MKSFTRSWSASSRRILVSVSCETYPTKASSQYGRCFHAAAYLQPLYHGSQKKRSYSTPAAPTPSRLSYRIAASSSGKGQRFDPDRHAYPFDPRVYEKLILSPPVVDPTTRRRRRADGGEDAFFVSKLNHNPGAVAFAVADGVGGWAESRVDPGEFSRALCSLMADAALAYHDPSQRLRPKALMQMAYDRLLDERAILAGGSTAMVGIACPDGGVELAKYVNPLRCTLKSGNN
jgi:protein phosphatase PTC7